MIWKRPQILDSDGVVTGLLADHRMHHEQDPGCQKAVTGGRNFYWDSPDRFEDAAGQLFAMGYDEIGVYYPSEAQRDNCERIAADVMPGLRL